jgi:hypothetical protein
MTAKTPKHRFEESISNNPCGCQYLRLFCPGCVGWCQGIRYFKCCRDLDTLHPPHNETSISYVSVNDEGKREYLVEGHPCDNCDSEKEVGKEEIQVLGNGTHIEEATREK